MPARALIKSILEKQIQLVRYIMIIMNCVSNAFCDAFKFCSPVCM